MGRPRVPLIDRDEAIAKALELIDRDGTEAFSIRKLGTELGVNGASLYHHFKDKEDILRGVRNLVLEEAHLFPRSRKNLGWKDFVVYSVGRYRAALLAHPNTAPLMTPDQMKPGGLIPREFLITRMFEGGVPASVCYPLIDSVETLAYGSALLNPHQIPPLKRYPHETIDLPNLDLAMRSTHRTADRIFRLQLDTLLDGWAMAIERAYADA